MATIPKCPICYQELPTQKVAELRCSGRVLSYTEVISEMVETEPISGKKAHLHCMSRDNSYKSMRPVMVLWSDGDTTKTNINGTESEVRNYYLNNRFNIGSLDDVIVTAVAVECLPVKQGVQA